MRRVLLLLCVGLTWLMIGCSANSGSSDGQPVISQDAVHNEDQVASDEVEEQPTENTASTSEQSTPNLTPAQGLDPNQPLAAREVGDAEEAALIIEIEKKRELPEGFVYVDEVLEFAFYEMRYYGENNFVGEQIVGYHAPLAILSEQAAFALKKAEQELNRQGYALLIYDAYRPHKAVKRFIEWAADEQDTLMQEQFYPDINKKDVFELGFLSRRSGHSRGSTIDLTLADKKTGAPLDMGGPYDFFGDISAHEAQGLTEKQSELRTLLKETMIATGFEPYRKEWWHYTLKAEPYPKQYFDFNVE